MSRARQPPLVTGISPNEGIAWTKVTIRGENLGTGPTDLLGKLKNHPFGMAEGNILDMIRDKSFT